MTEFTFELHLSTDEYLRYYKGVAKVIQVISFCGKTIQFPADKMRQFVSKEGVYGIFVMRLDNTNKFLSVKRLE